MSIDLAQKRGTLIGKLNSLRQEFHYVEPNVFVKILNIYATSFYGSSLWDLFSKEYEIMFNAWNVSIRTCFDVDRTTHGYFVKELSGNLHPKVMVCGRYAGFQQSLLKCKFPVRFLARLVQHDLRTVTGRNLRQIVLESGQGLLVQQFHYKTIIKKTMKYCPVPSSDAWRVSLLHDLLDIRNKMSTLTGFSTAEVEDMIQFICTS